MPNNCLSVLYKQIIQVENKNVGLKVGGGGTNIPFSTPTPPLPTPVCVYIYIYIYIYIHWRRKRGGGKGGMCPPPTFLIGGGGAMVCLCPPLLTPHFYFRLELYVCITLTNNYLAFFIYQLIILWTISINWHRWLLLNNHTSKYNSFIMVLYRRYINYVSVCPPPPPPHFLAPSYAIERYIYIYPPEAVPASGRVRNFKVCGHVNMVSLPYR